MGKNLRGQSLIEIILAMAIFSMLVSAMVAMVLGSSTGLILGGEELRASAIAEEGLEALHSVRDGAWNELIGANIVLSQSGGEWVISPGAFEIVDSIFKRIITLNPVCRNVSGAFVACPGSGTDYVDIHTLQAKVEVSWQTRPNAQNSVLRQGYITNWDSFNWIQTDWSGGSGQNKWSDVTKYDEDDNHMDIGTAGEAKLKLISAGNGWAQAMPEKCGGVTSKNLNAISVVSANDVWLVGNNGTALHYNGTTCQLVPTPIDQDLYGIDMVTSNDGWAAGAGGRILRWNGSSWIEFTNTGNHIWNAIHMLNATNGFAVGSKGAIARWNGTSWTPSSYPGYSKINLNSVYNVFVNDAWIVGGSGRILRWNGTSWSEFAITGNQTWNAIYMVSTTDGWVVGSGGNIRRYQNGNWNTSKNVPGVGSSLNGVYVFLASNDGWIVGNGGVILRWNGSNWSSASSPTGSILKFVEMLSLTSGWIAGNSGTVLNYFSQPAYEHIGVIDSSALDLGSPSRIQEVEWDENISACAPACSISLQVRAASNYGGLSLLPWSSLPEYGNFRGFLFPASYNGNQWLQYRAILRGDGTKTPVLNEIRVNYK